MTPYPLLLSVLVVVRQRSGDLKSALESVAAGIRDLVSDYELIVVDNSSTDDSVQVLRALTAPEGLPNLQVYALTREVDADTAIWAGVENAVGDFVVIFDPKTDSLGALPQMLEKAASGCDVVFAHNRQTPPQSAGYRLTAKAFNAAYKWLNGVDISLEAPRFRLLSRRVVNFILRHPMPALAYRHLPATGGFTRATLDFDVPILESEGRQLLDSIDRGVRLLVSTTRVPMRLVTALCLFGAAANLLYSVYVIAVAIFKTTVAEGWVTLSLQQSGMFFLISLVLLILGEYVLHVARLSSEGPPYHVAQEFTSASMTRRQRLNVESAPTPAAGEPARAAGPVVPREH